MSRRLMHAHEIERRRRYEVEASALAAVTPSRWWSPAEWLRSYVAMVKHGYAAKVINEILTEHDATGGAR